MRSIELIHREKTTKREDTVSPKSLLAQGIWGSLTFSRFLQGESPIEIRGGRG